MKQFAESSYNESAPTGSLDEYVRWLEDSRTYWMTEAVMVQVDPDECPSMFDAALSDARDMEPMPHKYLMRKIRPEYIRWTRDSVSYWMREAMA